VSQIRKEVTMAMSQPELEGGVNDLNSRVARHGHRLIVR